jgi:DNA-binding NtrC family response regulator
MPMQESSANQTKKTRVLIVDDERVIADTLVLILKKNGFEAQAAYSSREAMQVAVSFCPDKIISDVILADGSGIDAAIHICGLLPACKVILFSGQAATADLLEKARAQGYAFQILAKPVPPQELLAHLRT